MKPNSDPSDSLQEMLADEAAHLPAMAAQAARDCRARRARHRRRLAQGALILLLGACGWQTLLHWIPPEPKGNGVARNVIQQPARTVRESFVLARTMEEAVAKPLPPPPGATQEQKDLLESARGLPLLVVLDDSGKPPRIVVVER